MPGEIIVYVILLIVVVGVLPIVNLCLLIGCQTMLKDLSSRLKEVEKSMKDGAPAKQPDSPPKPEIRIPEPRDVRTPEEYAASLALINVAICTSVVYCIFMRASRSCRS